MLPTVDFGLLLAACFLTQFMLCFIKSMILLITPVLLWVARKELLGRIIMEKYQVNFSSTIWGEEYSISRYDKDGYIGRCYGTTYSDFQEYTDYGVFIGTNDACEQYIREHQ